MKLISYVTLALALAGLVMLAGCSSIKVLETWNSQAPGGKRYHKLFIVGIGHDEGKRKMAENILVNEMSHKAVMAVASHTLVKEIDSANRDDIAAAVRTAAADAVLTIRPVSKGVTHISQGGQSNGIYGTTTNVGGAVLPGASNYSLATLQANLYDSKSAALVWSATVSTFDANNVAKVSRDLAAFVLEELKKDGFL